MGGAWYIVELLSVFDCMLSVCLSVCDVDELTSGLRFLEPQHLRSSPREHLQILGEIGVGDYF